MTTPKRYLFAIIDGGGTVPADTSVIRAMVERGHDVRVLADRVLAPDIEPTGAEHVPWDRAPQRPNLDPQSVIMKDWDTSTPFQAFARVRDGRWSARRACSRRTSAPSFSVAPRTSSWELLRLRAQIAAEARGSVRVPRLNLLSFPESGTPPLGPGLKPARGPLGRPRSGDQPRHGAALRQGPRPAQRGGAPTGSSRPARCSRTSRAPTGCF